MTNALAPAPSSAADPPKDLPEYKLKAGFLFRFAKYSIWPEGAFGTSKSPLVIGIVGEDPFGGQLEAALSGKSLEGRTFEIKRFAKASDIQRCHILFIPKTERENLFVILKRIAGWPVLTVGEDDKFCRGGGMLSIVIKNEKPSLLVNPGEAAQARIEIDAKLLKSSEIQKTDVPK